MIFPYHVTSFKIFISFWLKIKFQIDLNAQIIQ